MNYQQRQPPDYLKAYVRYFWILESDGADSSPKSFRPITDGCPGLFFRQAQTGTFYDQDEKQLPALFLYGQTIQHRELHTSTTINALGICFYPHALKSVFGLDADELTDTCVDVNVLAGASGFFLADKLLTTTSTAHQLDLLSAYLWDQIRTGKAKKDAIIDFILAQLMESEGSVSLREVQKKVNVSERSIERKFKQYVGISPKLFARICQFQASLTQLRSNQYSKLSDIAFENGYADQSHFIRVFREFAGFSPYQYRTQSNEVVENLAEWIR